MLILYTVLVGKIFGENRNQTALQKKIYPKKYREILLPLQVVSQMHQH